MMFRHTAMTNDTKETLIKFHMLDLKKENWFTEVKQLFAPEESPETKVLRRSARLFQP
jgi:hypothetical protein